MNTNKDLTYRLYLQKEEAFTRMSFKSEFERYKAIQLGDVFRVKNNFIKAKENFNAGKGILSDDPVRNMRYHMIISTAIVARVCVEGGMNHDDAYTLSDIYIQKADKCNDESKLLDMIFDMQLDFAQRMKALKKKNSYSVYVKKCVEYIYEHLHEKITVPILADYVGLNETYLSKLFSKEMNMSISKFIVMSKVQTAENMLVYSDMSYLEIANSLNFSSQSAFIASFKKYTGQTPANYRKKNYYSDMLDV